MQPQQTREFYAVRVVLSSAHGILLGQKTTFLRRIVIIIYNEAWYPEIYETYKGSCGKLGLSPSET